MKQFLIFLVIVFALALNQVSEETEAAVPANNPGPEMVNIATCPSEDAFIFDEDGFYWRMHKGGVSDYYNTMTVEAFKKEAEKTGSPTDLSACPPANGYMTNRMGGTLNLPMGFFDDEGNWMTTEEFENR
ncbi:MAG: amidohydrolase family protein [Planctomycetota bacterium]|jgi:hypothetical protein